VRFARFLGRVGRVLITVGVLILLFVAYQLWGTGLHTADAQNDAEREFEAAQQAFEDNPTLGPDDGATTTTAGAGGTTTTAAPDSTTTTTTPVGSDTIPPPPGPGGLVGNIEIPAIGANWYFYEGVDLSILKDGPGHYMGTPLPGQEGNAAIAGHRTTYGAPFNRVDELKSGDEIIITYPTGAKFTYGYRSTEVVSPSQTEVLQAKDFDEDGAVDNMLTLTACHPKYSARERIVIRARLNEGQVAQPVPAGQLHDEIGPNLDEDATSAAPVSKTPAILWGLAAGMIWIAAFFLGRAWRKWPAYFLGFPFFMVALFIFFENFYALLPAGF
jgi:sortase A